MARLKRWHLLCTCTHLPCRAGPVARAAAGWPACSRPTGEVVCIACWLPRAPSIERAQKFRGSLRAEAQTLVRAGRSYNAICEDNPLLSVPPCWVLYMYPVLWRMTSSQKRRVVRCIVQQRHVVACLPTARCDRFIRSTCPNCACAIACGLALASPYFRLLVSEAEADCCLQTRPVLGGNSARQQFVGGL